MREQTPRQAALNEMLAAEDEYRRELVHVYGPAAPFARMDTRARATPRLAERDDALRKATRVYFGLWGR